MKTRFFFVIFLWGLSASYAQHQRMLDSLEQVLSHTSQDVQRLNLLGELSWRYGMVDFEKALHYGRMELQLAVKMGDSAAIALAYSDIGNAYTRVNSFDEALENHLKAYEIRDRLGLSVKAAGSISNISVIYKQQGRYQEALDYMFRALRIYEQTADEINQALVLGNIGNLYVSYKKLDPAKEAFERAIRLAKKNNSVSILANAHSGMVQYYFKKEQYHEALEHAFIAEKHLKPLQHKTDLAVIYNGIGQIYERLEKFDLAMENYQRSLEFRKFMKDEFGIASCYKNMGSVYLKLKDFDKAEKYILQSKTIFMNLKAQDYLREVYHLLGQVYEEKDHYSKSLAYYKASEAVKDSLYNQQSSDKIHELQVAYETERKARQIELLNKENRIQKLEIFRRNMFLGGVSAAFVSFFIITYLLFRSYRFKQENRLQGIILHQQSMAANAVIEAEENERKRISAELHDGLGQLFSAVKMNLSALTDDILFKDNRSKDTYEKTISLVDESCREVRVISHQMAPNELLKSGLSNAIRNFIHKIDSRTLKINLQADGLEERLDTPIETVLYRAIQEAVNNVIKHAHATMLDIQLFRDEEGISVTIEDNGSGFDPKEAIAKNGMGLKNIRSRIEYLKGQVEFSSIPGKGALVAIYIPLTNG